MSTTESYMNSPAHGSSPNVGQALPVSENVGDTTTSEENQDETTSNGLASNNADDSSIDDEVILCVFFRKSKLAAAAYFVATSEMHLVYDIIDPAPDFCLLRKLFQQLKPNQIVTCPSLSDVFLRTVHSLVTGESVSISPSADPPNYTDKFHFIPTKEFRYSSCKRQIMELQLPGVPDADRHHYVLSTINLGHHNLVSAVGALLYFLQRSQARLALSALDCPILAVNTLSLKDIVWLDEETISTLQIFSPIAHPSSYKWSSGGGVKEGVSIFSLLNRCHSTAGAKHMRVMLSQPTRDVDVLCMRHEVISFCMKATNTQTVKSISDSIAHVNSVLKILTKMTNAQASIAQWKAFYNTVYNAVLIGEVCRAHAEESILFEQIADCLCDSIFLMSHCINRTMDFEASTMQNRVVVKFGISEELDTLKERHQNLGIVMGEVVQQELEKLPSYIESCQMVYIPEVGYLLAIPYWQEELTEEQLQALPDLQYKFKTKEAAHYKSARCYELDNLLGDVQLKVIEWEATIVLKLVQYIQRNISPLVQLTSLIAELDCLLALAQAARDYNLVKPQLTTDKQLHITKGRHILQELCVDMFVPNDTHSSPDHGYVKILSGPNASGKSVYLKQVALIVFLAQIGSFVPAEAATIGVVDQIHARIQTVESVSTLLSAFMIDLRQMSTAIRNAKSSSLVLIDEFGKGTSEVDGLGILTACLEHFIEKQNHCPHLFVSTHFHSLSKLLPADPLIRLQHLEHVVDKGEVVYLYRLKEGSIESSFALQVAQSQGLSATAAERANQILNGLRDAKEISADSSNKQAQLAARKRAFLKSLSKNKLEEKELDKMKRMLLHFRLEKKNS